MFPSRNMFDYMSEMNRLFSRTESDNAYSLAAQSPYNSTINRSSSSTDSTSPESFPDITTFQQENLRPVPESPSLFSPPLPNDSNQLAYDTPKASNPPFLLRRQRPIVGRKILTPEMQTPNIERVQVSPIPRLPEEGMVAPMWMEDPILFQQTPPNYSNIFINHTNIFYELFPNEKGYEFKTPVTTSPTVSSNMSNVSSYEYRTPVKTSPTMSYMSNVSPRSPTLSNISSTSPMGPRPSFRQRSPSVSSSYTPGPSRFNNRPSSQKMCSFCKKNGETPVVYMTHTVKQKVDNKFIVSCPILRSHVCSTCGETGDNAHTITYCPLLLSSNNGLPLQSTTITLKNTRIKSNGRRRFN